MCWMNFFVEMSKSWAWPIALIFLLWFFHRLIKRAVLSIVKVFRQVQSFKYKDIELTLRTQIVKNKNDDLLATIQKLSDVIASSKTVDPEEKARFAEKFEEAKAENETLRSALTRQSTLITSFETPATQLNPMRLVAKLLGASNVGIQLGTDDGKEKTRREAQSIFNKIRYGQARHLYLTPAIIDELVQKGFFEDSGLLTDAGMSELLRWATHELKRPSPSYPLL